MLYDWFLLLDQFRFCETHFTTCQRFVADQSAISPFLGGICVNMREYALIRVKMRWTQLLSTVPPPTIIWVHSIPRPTTKTRTLHIHGDAPSFKTPSLLVMSVTLILQTPLQVWNTKSKKQEQLISTAMTAVDEAAVRRLLSGDVNEDASHVFLWVDTAIVVHRWGCMTSIGVNRCEWGRCERGWCC